MFFTIFLIFIFSKITRILSINNDFPIYSLEQEVIKEISLDNINLNSKIIYIISTNNISGTYTYDIQSPYLLELSYGKSDYSFKLPDLFSGNFHKNEKKERYFYYDIRKVVLYDTPRIEYIEPENLIIKGTINLNKNCSAQLIKSNQFELITPKRTFIFMCKDRYDISPWVSAINNAIDKFSK